MLYYLSRLKEKISDLYINRSREDEIWGALLYPPDLARAETLILNLLQDVMIFPSSVSHISRRDLKSLNYEQLLIIHKYLNSKLEVTKGTILFHEILRRDFNPIRILYPHGCKRFLMSSILMEGIRKESKFGSITFKMFLTLLFKITNKQISSSQRDLASSASAVIIGGGADIHGNLDKMDLSNTLVCGVNRLSCHDIPCSISYFRGEALSEMERKGQLNALQSASAYISVKLPLIFRKMPKNRSALTTNVDLATPYGTFNAVPAICLDLIRYKVNKMCLVCVDFNLGAWGKDYSPVHSKAVDKTLIFGQHPAPIQFLLIKSLSKHYDISLGENPYISINNSYREFINVFKIQCKTFKGEC